MKSKRRGVAVAVLACSLVGVACGGDDGGDSASPEPDPVTSAGPTTTFNVVLPTAAVPRTTVARPDGVEEYSVAPSHVGPGVSVDYAQLPPVGGPHSTTWETCAFYDRVLPAETAVHSLEHGAIWITYRPGVPEEDMQVLRDLARSRFNVLVSRWDEGLPSPIVASSWGRQLKLESARDPRLVQFIGAFSGQSPEPNGPC